MHAILSWWFGFTGAKNEGGWVYGLWSGFGGAVPDFMILGGLIGAYRHINCHSKGCWRVARHEYEMNGVTLKLCRKCHPSIDHKNRPTRSDVLEHAKKPKRAANGRFV